MPLHRVVADFSHIHRQVHTVAEGNEAADGLLRRSASIAVAGQHDFPVERRIGYRLKIAVPLRSAQQKNMVGVYLPYDGSHAAVKRHQTRVEHFLVLEIMSYRLVHQVVAENDGLVLVAFGNTPPDVAEQLLAPFADQQPRISVAVVNVITGLSTGSIVHVKDEVQSFCAAPRHDAVDTLKSVMVCRPSHVVFIGKQLVVKRQAYRVAACRTDKTNVVAGDIVVLETLPELSREVRSDELTEHFVDEVR